MFWLLAGLLVLFGVAAVLADRRSRRATPPEPAHHDRLDRRAAHYRASGALPRWD